MCNCKALFIHRGMIQCNVGVASGLCMFFCLPPYRNVYGESCVRLYVWSSDYTLIYLGFVMWLIMGVLGHVLSIVILCFWRSRIEGHTIVDITQPRL